MKIEEQAKQLNSRDLKSIPNGWRLMNIGDIGNIVTGSTPSTNNEKFYNGEWLFISPSDIGFKNYIVDSIKKLSDEGIKVSRKLPVGTVAVTCIGELGKVGILQKECATNQQINAVICDSDIIDNEYFYYAMQQYKGQLNIIAGLQVVPIVNKTQFSRIVLPVPTNLSEQKKIAEVLASIDNVIETTKQLIDKYKKVKQGLMQDLFTRGIQPDGKLRPKYEEAPELYKPTQLGFLPKDWDDELLENLTEKIIDGTHATPRYTEVGVPFLRVTDIQDRLINFNNLKYISRKEHEELIKRCKPEYGDILYSKNGTVGIPKVVDWKWEFSIFVSLALIKPKKNIVYNKYLYYLLQSFLVSRQIMKRAKQGTVTNLHLEEIREFIIPLPKYEEQILIANALTAIDNKINKEEEYLEKLETIKKGLMQDLLTGKVRVKVEGDRDE
jgi:type I restriction enzyme S subunit